MKFNFPYFDTTIIKNKSIINTNKFANDINIIVSKYLKSIIHNKEVYINYNLIENKLNLISKNIDNDITFKNFKKYFITELKSLIQYYKNSNIKYNFNPKNLNIYNIFLKQGFYTFNFSSKKIETINLLLKNEIKELLESEKNKINIFDRGSNYDKFLIIKKREVLDFVKNEFNKMGIFDIYQTYFNKKYDNKFNITLHISDEYDEHYKLTYKEKIKKNLPKTTNIHFDPKNNILKVILYLKENIEDNDGPFCYIPTSNLWDKDEIDYPLKSISAKVNGVTNYLENEEKIENFSKYPKLLSYYSVFGNLLKDNEDLSNFLLSKEHKFISQNYQNNMILFDPNGIHRGGISKKNGNRISFQINFS